VHRDAHYAATVIEGTVNGAGSAVNAVAAELGADMAEVKARSREWLESFNTDLMYLNAVSGLGSPWWLADMPSRFEGSAAGTADVGERIAAVLESIAFLLVTNLDAMRAVVGEPKRLLATGGLAAVDPLLGRIASLAQLPVERTATAEATARGLACLLAGLPADWPAASIEHSFMPVADAALVGRYRRWLELMPEL
jgi:glycerol kinase